MEIVPIDPSNPDPQSIQKAARVLRSGGILVYPTDTCYGLGADAQSLRAMQRVTELKGGREAAKRYSVIARDLEHIASLTVLNETQRKILTTYLPGPFTFILLNADFSVASTSTLGVRWPDYPVTQAIADSFGDAYITTSANLKGQGAIYSVDELKDSFFDLVDSSLWPDLILDAGPLTKRLPSTVVNITGSVPRVIREGGRPFQWPRANDDSATSEG